MNATFTDEQTAIKNCLTQTDLSNKKHAGKVRDTYDLDNRLLIVTTDRLSAFDRQLTAIPFKGQVLNQTSIWWFLHTKHIINNHFISSPDPNIMIVKKCKVFSITTDIYF